ncbi:Hcp family type VI secretion system effector [Ottowia pentelensis]|uniref:Hcp family type VI secretion system effector n=1 Tax=Ottowia pentelensis TaxID=511108 RepID=A0ABV6PN35_9BURK
MAVDMFLKISGVEGESADDKHKKEIDVLAWDWGATQSGTTHIGTGGGSGKVSAGDLSVTKYVDSASHALLLACCNGEHYNEAVLVVRKAGKEAVEYVKITMSTVLVSSVHTGGAKDEERLTERVSLNFAKIKFEYTPQNADGSAGATKTAGWDIAANKKL